jgi:hypothetical protein
MAKEKSTKVQTTIYKTNTDAIVLLHIYLAWGYITSLSPPHVTKVPVPIQKSKWSCIYVLGISILPISTIFLLYCGNAPTLWYFFYFHFIRNIIKTHKYMTTYFSGLVQAL